MRHCPVVYYPVQLVSTASPPLLARITALYLDGLALDQALNLSNSIIQNLLLRLFILQ